MDGLLLPTVDEDSRAFWEGTLLGELRVHACGGCSRLRFPPRPMCPACQSLDVEWKAMSGQGTIYSFVVPHPPLLPAYAAVAPYNAVLVELDEDPAIRMVGNLVTHADADINSVDPATISIGAPVSVVFARVSDEIALPRWVLRS